MEGVRQRLPDLMRPPLPQWGPQESPTVAGELGPYPHYHHPLHTPKGKGGDSCRCLPHFSFP